MPRSAVFYPSKQKRPEQVGALRVLQAGSGGDGALKLVHRILFQLTDTLGRDVVLGRQLMQRGLLFGQPALLQDIAAALVERFQRCLLYTSPSPRDKRQSRMPSSA